MTIAEVCTRTNMRKPKQDEIFERKMSITFVNQMTVLDVH